VRGLRDAPRAPLAVAGILAMPLFFVGLMAMSLAVEKPGIGHTVEHGKPVTTLGDPSGSTEARIWLFALLPTLALLLAGTLAMRLGRAGVVATSVAAILISVALLAPLATWDRRHSARYPIGADLIPPSAGSEDIYLRGEWEANAKRTAEQLGIATIAIGGVAIVAFVLIEARRRRGAIPPPPPPPPALATGGAPPIV
jgi:hypothetical protein